MKAGIAVDNWKLPIFCKRLTEAGYDYVDGGALTADAVTDYLIEDLAKRKRAELLDLAQELDELRGTLVDQARINSFALLDDILAARQKEPKP